MLRRSLIFLVLLSAGCVSLEPHYSTPESPIPATLPEHRARERQSAMTGSR